MRYDERYPLLTNPQKLYPERLIGPHPEVVVPEKHQVVQSWRVYPCGVCALRTGWRLTVYSDCPLIPCCSEECEAQLLANEKALAETQSTPVLEPVSANPLELQAENKITEALEGKERNPNPFHDQEK